MFTAIQDSVIELVARGERGVPGTPGDYDYETADAAANQFIPAIRKTVRVGGRHTTLDRGSAIYVRVASEPNHPGKFQSLDLGWWELNEEYPTLRMFGARGDGVTDDTNAIQDAFDYCVAKSCAVSVTKGNYLVGPLYFNGRAWRDSPSTNGAQPSARGLIGEGLIVFEARFVAKTGAYTSGQAVITARNLTFKVITGIHIDCNFVADVGLDVAWIGGTSSGDSTAPACGNTFTNLLVENALAMGINFNQAADCLIQNITYRGGTPPVAFSLKLPGGAIQANNLRAYRGRWEIACQNAQFSDSLMLGGLQLIGAAINMVTISSCQLSTDPLTGYTVYSSATEGYGTHEVFFHACDFLGGAAHTYYFAGRWNMGAKFIGTHFELKPSDTMFNPAVWTPVGGPGRPPIFDFEHCSWHGGGPGLPASIPEKVLVGTYACKRPDTTVIARRDFPSDIQVGTGLIVADKANLTGNGFFARGQGVAAPPTDAFFGQGYNRSGSLAEVEQFIRGQMWRLTQYDGATFTTHLTFNAGSANGLYPGNDNVRNLGIASNRWATVFAGTSAISTSDARLKTPIEPLTEAEIQAGLALGDAIGSFHFLDAMEDKGNDARIHCGLTVQGAIEIMETHGLDPMAYGFICYDAWPAEVIQYPPVYDADGVLMQPGYTEVVRQAGDVYSFRADELQFFVIRALMAQRAEQEGKIGLHEQRIGSQEILLAAQEERLMNLEALFGETT